MKVNNSKCLLLNADYSPIHIISWQKAIVWNIRYENNKSYGIEIIDFYKDDFIQCVDKRIPIPAIAKTKRFFKINNQTVNFSRKNIFIRDDYRCQYCYKQFAEYFLTYDHVIPKSMWKLSSSPTTWTNIVTCCTSCNRKKGCRTPKQANMFLHNIPNKPYKTAKYLPVTQLLLNIKNSGHMPEEWKLYLPNFEF